MNERSLGQLADELHNGYLGYAGVTSLLQGPYTNDLMTRIESDNVGPAPVPTEAILRKDGSAAFFDVSHAVRRIIPTSIYRELHDRLWLGGALLTLGDEFARVGYLDKGPDLEFIRHLRNGVAHGNRFHLTGDEPKRSAHFTGPDRRLMANGTVTPAGEAHIFEITAALNGQRVLFDFMGPGDVCDLLMFVSSRLVRIGDGDAPLDLWAQRK